MEPNFFLTSAIMDNFISAICSDDLSKHTCVGMSNKSVCQSLGIMSIQVCIDRKVLKSSVKVQKQTTYHLTTTVSEANFYW